MFYRRYECIILILLNEGDVLTVEKRMQLVRGLLGEDPEPRGWVKKMFRTPTQYDNVSISQTIYPLFNMYLISLSFLEQL